MKTTFACLVLIIFISNGMAQQYGWGAVLKDLDKKVKIGGRLQGILDYNTANGSQDFYLRRTRLNLDYRPWDGHQFVYDIRNDKANFRDSGEEEFVIGDAYWKIRIDKWSINNIKLFRAKVDVSYSQTSSSKNLFNPQRNDISEYASDFIVQNRRANNIQANGNIGNLAYQVYVSDGVQKGDLEDLGGTKVRTVNHQRFSYGTKLRYFFLGDARKNRVQDTFFGEYDTISLGVGYGRNDKINVTSSDNSSTMDFERAIVNLDVSVSLGGFRFLGEYFDFDGILVDENAALEANRVGTASGYFAQAEYVYGKWAPYLNYERYDKWDTQDGYLLKSHSFGINYYTLMEAMRFGVVYKKTTNEVNVGNNENKETYAYMMLNF